MWNTWKKQPVRNMFYNNVILTVFLPSGFQMKLRGDGGQVIVASRIFGCITTSAGNFLLYYFIFVATLFRMESDLNLCPNRCTPPFSEGCEAVDTT